MWTSNVRIDKADPPKKLILFDIDWTLLVCAGVQYKTHGKAIQNVFGMKASVSPEDLGAGRTDPEMLKMLARKLGIAETEIDAKQVPLQEFMCSYYEENVQKEGGMVLQGIQELLQKIDEKGYLRGVVTGNLERIAYAKLKKFGLEKGFALGAFGSDHEDRARLIQIAIDRAVNLFNFRYDHQNVVYIGDSPSDVKSGERAGVPVIIHLHRMNEKTDFKDAKPLGFLKGGSFQADFFKMVS